MLEGADDVVLLDELHQGVKPAIEGHSGYTTSRAGRGDATAGQDAEGLGHQRGYPAYVESLPRGPAFPAGTPGRSGGPGVPSAARWRSRPRLVSPPGSASGMGEDEGADVPVQGKAVHAAAGGQHEHGSGTVQGQAGPLLLAAEMRRRQTC